LEEGDKTNGQDDALQRLERQISLDKLSRQMRLSSFSRLAPGRPHPSREPEKPANPQPLRRLDGRLDGGLDGKLDFSLAQFEELKEVIIIERTIGVYVKREDPLSPKREDLRIIRCAYVVPASWAGL